MAEVITPRELRAVQNLPFCYACGETFTDDHRNRDHVPARSCISTSDRAHNPLILPSHVTCNDSFTVSDERVGQYLSLLHGKLPAHNKSRLNYIKFSRIVGGKHSQLSQAITNVDMYGVVWRWIRAFHSALYQQPIPQNTNYAIELPIDVISPTETGHIEDGGRVRQRNLCDRTIKRNRLTKTLDRLAGWNGKLLYECVWIVTPSHAYCVFWLDFYSWRRMARLNGHEPRDCVGFYQLHVGEMPKQATLETQIITDENRTRFFL